MKKITIIAAALLALLPLSSAFATASDCDMCKESIEWKKSAQDDLHNNVRKIEDAAYRLRANPALGKMHDCISISESVSWQLRNYARLTKTIEISTPEGPGQTGVAVEPNRQHVQILLQDLANETAAISHEARRNQCEDNRAYQTSELKTIDHQSDDLLRQATNLYIDCADVNRSCREILGHDRAKHLYLMAANMVVTETKAIAETKGPGTASVGNEADTLADIECNCHEMDKTLNDYRLPLLASAKMTKSWDSLRSLSASLLEDVVDYKNNSFEGSKDSAKEAIYRKAAKLVAAMTQLQAELFKISYVD
jgi:hypothetical protein